MWVQSTCVLLVLVFIQSALGDAWFELRLVKFHNPDGKGNNGNCCESPFSWTCSSGSPSSCDPSLKICVDDRFSPECTDHPAVYTGEYPDTHSFTFGSTFNSGTSNPMTFPIAPWKAAVKVTIKVDDIDGGVGGDHDSMGKTSVIFEESLGASGTAATWYDVTFHYSHQTITAQARAYCVDHYYGANCAEFCQPMDDATGHYTCSAAGARVCRDHYHGESCLVYCQAQDGPAGHFSCNHDGTHSCNTGWTGDTACTEDINECLNATDNPCYPHGNCSNTNGSYSCVCDDAYTGTDCQDVRVYCDEDPCTNHTALCNDTLGGFQCVCQDGWTGHICQEEITACTDTPCLHNGTCAVINDTFECNCTEPWEGNTCDTVKPDPCADRPCLNNGICAVAGDTYTCICVRHWQGTECQTRAFTLEDDTTIYLDGYLLPEYFDQLRDGIQRLLETLNITDTNIRTTVTYPDEKTTRVDIFVESSNPDIPGSLHKLFKPVTAEETTEVNSNLPLPLTARETATPVSVKQDPWVKGHWYVILIVILVIVLSGAAIVAVLYILKRRRLSRMKKSGFDNTGSMNGVRESIPDAAIGFDNSLYFEVNQPDRVTGITEKY